MFDDDEVAPYVSDRIETVDRGSGPAPKRRGNTIPTVRIDVAHADDAAFSAIGKVGN